MEDLHRQHEDVAADASRAAAAYLSVALAAAHTVVQRRTAAAARAAAACYPDPPVPPPTTAPKPGAPALPAHGGQPARDLQDRQAMALTVQEVLPDLAPAVLADPGWPDLARELHRQKTAGADPASLLRDSAGQRDFTGVRHPARVLAHRLHNTTPPPTQGGSQPLGGIGATTPAAAPAGLQPGGVAAPPATAPAAAAARHNAGHASGQGQGRRRGPGR